ncbi:SAC3 family protein A isoform X2 [Ziziphus jujuba]|uniref:SAC3 family protein A isoform X2 n=1 Tax=Ziziphus jujuba TaxID=326968 RepID=A0A6P3ZFC7_ZIZJJ|nr:SAC3 family protein A isoform X2 [Ziziphus jujuba]
MMNQGAETLATVDPSSLENRYVINGQGQASSYPPSAAGSEALSWTTHRVDNSSTENGIPSNSTYNYDPHMQQPAAISSSLGSSSTQQDYNGYTSYSNSSDPYAYGSTGYQGYYNNNYQQQTNSYQQQTNHSYSQPVGAYQNTGAPYQPLSSFQNTGSYAGSSSYTSTYYNPGDYQTAGGYPSSSYNNQTSGWNDGNYANYTSQQYANYTPDTNAVYSSGTAPATSVNYQQHYKQWADYYSQTEVSCAPGTENIAVNSTSNFGTSTGYPTFNSQPHPPYNQSWRPESVPSEVPPVQSGSVVSGAYDGYWKHGAPTAQIHNTSPAQPHFQKPLEQKSSYDSFQDQQKTACPQGPSLQYPASHQVSHLSQSPQVPHLSQLPQVPQLNPVPQTYQSPVQTAPSLDTRRVNKLQIPTNPRIASNLTFGITKTDKDSSTISAAAKPAYVSVSLPKPNEKTPSSTGADSMLKPGMFPKSLRGYVERALARCKDETQMMACQATMKDMITKATADGTLYTRDWDIEPLFPLPNSDDDNKEILQGTTPISILPKFKRSPNRRSKSRWEPLPDEKPIEKPAYANNNALKYAGWMHANEKDRKKGASKIIQRPVKKQRHSDGLGAVENGDASSDSDKEQGLTAYYAGASALANSPEERRRRESRSKRFEKGQGHRTETNHHKAKNSGAGNLYARRAMISKNFEDGASRAVEDMDWDTLTVKGTCQEIEKRYLRLTSAPDPSSVRPEEVLEKALLMVQNSQKNYLYKCDQLKSIRQDLTVQRIRNQLTAKVYETHARLALEVGDLPEYNQCQSQLKVLYAEGIEGCHMEFSAYHLLCVILHSNNYRDLLSSMSRLSDEAKRDKAVKHALAVRAAVTSGNYVMFFRLYKTAPNLNTCLMDLYVEKMRFKAVSCMSRSYRPTLPVSYIAQVLGFATVVPANEGSDEKDLDGVEECVEWLKAHGACLITDNNGEIQLDTKPTSSSLYMPEPEDAVSHGDASLAVNDFLTRTTL